MEALLLGPGNPGPRQEAMAEGLEAFGYRVQYGRQTLASMDGALVPDVVLAWGEVHPQTAPIFAARRAHGLKSVVYDLPLFRFAHADADWVGLYAGRVGAAWDCPASDARLQAMGLTPLATRARPPIENAVLLLAQVPGDAQHGMDDTMYAAWMAEAVAACPLPVFVRPHPKARTVPIPMGCEVADVNVPIAEQITQYAGCLTYNSSAKYECYRAGIPCAVWEYGERWPEASNAAQAAQRLAQASWNDWHVTELRRADTWDVMLNSPPVVCDTEVPRPRMPKRRRKAVA